MSNSQLNKIKSGIKHGTEVTLKLSSNVVGNSSDETNLPHKLSLTDAQVARILKAFANNSSTYVKLLRAQLSKIG